MDDEELARQLRAWSPPDGLPATERWRVQPERASAVTAGVAPGDAVGGDERSDGTAPPGGPGSADLPVPEPLELDQERPRRTAQRVLVAATVLVLAVVAVYAFGRAAETDPIGSDVDVPTTVASTATFGTMPSRPPGGGRVDDTNVPDYISVVDGQTTSDEIIGYIRSDALLNPNLPISHPDEPRDERVTILRLYNTSEQVIGYEFPGVGPVLGAEADALLATGDYVIDPVS
jgi:hypothetical protein